MMKLYRPFQRALLTQGYAANANPYYKGQGLKGHSGEDYGANWGTPIRNVAPSAYVYAVRNSNHPDPSKYRAVYTIVNDGKDWYEVSYGHCSTMTAEVGKTYNDGDTLAYVGNTGDVYSGGKAITKEARLKGSKAGTHLHFQMRAVSRVTKTSSKKHYLEDGHGLLKLDGYYFEWKHPTNGYNSCIDPAPFYLDMTTEEAARKRESLKKQVSLLSQLVGLLTRKQSTGGDIDDTESGIIEPMQNNKFAFLTSPRFWQLALVGLATGLTVYDQTTNWITALNAAIGIWFGGSVLVGSYDRAQDKKVEAAEIAAIGI